MPLSKLNRSFAALYAWLDDPHRARRVLVALLAIHAGLLAYSAYVHSPTLNEPGHLVAGLSHWKFGRFELYRVNPPLVRMVAALPAMAVGYEEDWSGFYEGPGARPVFGMGEDFVAANGERSFLQFMIARWACIPFSWLGAIVCYLWARDLYGRPAGVLASSIWCFEPNILAHASLITPDAPASALGLAACYMFWRWLKNPTWQQAALTGVVLGLAELAKTTLILFYPLWLILWLLYRLIPNPQSKIQNPHSKNPQSNQGSGFGVQCGRESLQLALCFLLSLYILNLGYAFEGSFKRLNEFRFVSNLFTGADSIPQFEIRNPQSPTNPQSAIRNQEIRNPKSQIRNGPGSATSQCHCRKTISSASTSSSRTSKTTASSRIYAASGATTAGGITIFTRAQLRCPWACGHWGYLQYSSVFRI